MAPVREVWRMSVRVYRLSEMCGNCQRSMATVREVWRLSGRCGNCKGGVATDKNKIP